MLGGYELLTGFEPINAASKTAVLPLNDRSMRGKRESNPSLCEVLEASRFLKLSHMVVIVDSETTTPAPSTQRSTVELYHHEVPT